MRRPADAISIDTKGRRMQREDIDALKRRVDALDQIMDDWVRWQERFTMKLGYPSHSSGVSCGGLSSFEDLCDSVDGEKMRIVDGVIQEDLTPIERAAILRRYGVAAVFRFRDYEGVLAQAHDRLFVILPRKGVMIF
jgi:hypothetical protein